jgi:tetratricopeptide (TPR) repeat protein
MYRSSLFLITALVGENIALIQPLVAAKSAVEVGEIAKAITLEIKATKSGKIGSGIILQQEGDVYTVLTAGHVVNTDSAFTLKTSDGAVHRSLPASVKLAASNLDLGVLKFRSNKKYTLAKLGKSSPLKELSPLYVAGFPESTYAIEAGTLNITKGEVVGNATKGNSKGYSLIYSNTTFRGMSGGPVLNEAGELVAIHGQGDRDGKEGDGEKTGRNLGIVVERFTAASGELLGVQLERQTTALPKSSKLNAADYFLKAEENYDSGDFQSAVTHYDQAITINPKYADAYNNRGLVKIQNLNDVPGALADFNRAIAIDPNYGLAYNNRGLLKANNLNDVRGSLADYNQAIALNPKFSLAYYNRAVLKKNKLGDFPGSLADFDQAIAFNSKFTYAYNNRANLKFLNLNDYRGALADFDRSLAIDPSDPYVYYNRAVLKDNKFNNVQGALADFNRAIEINPKLALAYKKRAILKLEKLNDRSGAITDFRQAARLFREQGSTKNLQLMLDRLREMGTTE